MCAASRGVPFPSLVLLAFGIGVAAALSAGHELRINPRHALLTASFKAFALFVALLLLPVSLYFYVFHGDWFLLYAIDVRRVPSAVALVGLSLEAAIAVLGFLTGAAFARAQRPAPGYAVALASVLAAASVALVWRDRLAVVGTFSQHRGDYGLHPYGGALLQGGLVLGGILLVGVAYLLARIWQGQRRG